MNSTQEVALYPLHYVTNAYAQFEVATSHGFGVDEFKRKLII